ncbi:hypothetical protein D3C77_735570 [compost metagenome]
MLKNSIPEATELPIYTPNGPMTIAVSGTMISSDTNGTINSSILFGVIRLSTFSKYENSQIARIAGMMEDE